MRKKKLSGFVDVDNKEELEKFNGAGIHLKKYFSMSEEDYSERYNGMLQLYSSNLQDTFVALGIENFASVNMAASHMDSDLVSENGTKTEREENICFSNILFEAHWSLSKERSRLSDYVRSKHTHVDS